MRELGVWFRGFVLVFMGGLVSSSVLIYLFVHTQIRILFS